MSGKRALVTGASDGIGRVFAERLAREGYEVTAIARNEAKLKELIGSLGGAGQSHRYMVADLSEPDQVQRIADELTREKYDLLVNNAGVGVYGQFEESSLERLQQMCRLNCDALVALSHAFLKRSQRGDALINVASSLALLAFPGSSLYAATKAFVLSFSESLWFEQKDRGVYVMGLCPGVTTTNFHTASGGDEKSRPPKGISQTAEAVVEEAMRALGSRSKPTLITGGKNRAMVFFTRLMPRKSMVNMMGGFGPR